MRMTKEPRRWKEGWRERNRLDSHAEWGSCNLAFHFHCFVFLTVCLSLKVILNLPSPLFCPVSRSAPYSFSPYSVHLCAVKNAASDSPSSSVRSAPSSCFMEDRLGIIAVHMILFVFGTKLTDLYFYHSSCRDWKERFERKQKKPLFCDSAYDYSLSEHTADLSLRQLSRFDLSQSLFAAVAHFIVRGIFQSELHPITSWKNKVWQTYIANHSRFVANVPVFSGWRKSCTLKHFHQMSISSSKSLQSFLE